MARFAVNEMTTFRWTFEEDVQSYLQAGIRALGVWRQKLSDIGEEKGAELLAESQAEVSSLSWAGGFTGSDGRSFKEAVADAVDAVEMAGALKASCLIIYTGARAGHTHNHARRLVRTALSELAEAAERQQVTLALEPMHEGCASEWTFLTNLDDTLEVIDSIKCSRLKLVLDTYHFGLDPAVVERLPELASRIALVQLGDARRPPQGEQDRCRLGDGEIPLPEIVRRLTRGGYDGFYELELLGEEIESFDYAELLKVSKDSFEQLVTN
ncbi:MAG: sugar phosphate isomerase/epimerase [Planctomycetales bacterium]|nr:sugar phosphate isomerase/epimerase [Planctomycetales bacterium]MCA9202822.1 sugar phosphate isomerase/epimerase [Planctomycetales bacterium]MCA9209756.1 sugar phosphate isomerase/epimerase [Planctomycetales bacterium]MCA9221279.1 sugar phosphate isomerase/epimerase [Planctomycetales bacterium]